MDTQIRHVIEYFAFFSYPPTEDEIYDFYGKIAKKAVFVGHLNQLVREGKLVQMTLFSEKRYTFPKQKAIFSTFKKRRQESQRKMEKVALFLKMLAWIPSVQAAFYTGSISLFNADKESDVDLFIITKNKSLWTGRFFTVILAQALGLRRVGLAHRLCLNLFFDESELKIPKQKQNLYVAHEVLQMKPIFIKNNVHQKLLQKNTWVYNFFPNAKKPVKQGRDNDSLRLSDNPVKIWLELMFKKLQLNIINRRLGQEIITENQLWLFTEDFQKKLPPKMIK